MSSDDEGEASARTEFEDEAPEENTIEKYR